ncbi:MAG: LptF/LptG family permease [Phycisphaerae bacterium]|nr:LptF/LptG family permease [Phycisphaerae bacterium]
MNKTLLRYIGLDLLKATGLTLIVLTLTLTTLGIIEPLRKQGLDASQVLLVFTMTLPVMLSFTMPFAALFAACFVYGRFSQDNELLASRASGISTITLLRPAIILGILVTLTSWSLSNYLAPIMAKRGTEAITSNIRGMMCRRLNVNGFLGFQDMIIHADRVHRYPDKDYDKLEGAIVIRATKKGGHVKIASAKSARARFGINHETLRAFVNITLDDAVLMASDDPSVRTQKTFPLESVSFDRRIKEKPTWYSWDELRAALNDPSVSITVQQAIPKIQQDICSDIFAKRIVASFQATGVYDKLTRHNDRYVIKAPNAAASTTTLGKIVLGGSGADTAQRIEIIEYRNGKRANKITSSSGRITIIWDKFTRQPAVSITLDKDARSTNLSVADDDPTGAEARAPRGLGIWQRGQIRIPDDIAAEIDAVTPYEAYHNGGKDGGLTDNPAIHDALHKLNNQHVVKLRRDIISEMHTRSAYSISCLLMVTLGGVLGLIFRGGQFVSALVTATMPAGAVIVTILMGKNIAQNPGVMLADNYNASIALGITIIWGGIALLAAATGFAYWRVSRK